MQPEHIKELRRELGLTQAHFARALSVTPQTVYLWERQDSKGGHRPTRYDLVVLERLHEKVQDAESREQTRQALLKAAQQDPGPSSSTANTALKAGALGFGLGLLLCYLFRRD